MSEEQKEHLRRMAQARKAAAATAEDQEHIRPPSDEEPAPVIREPEAEGPLLSDGEMERIRAEARKAVDEELAKLNAEKKKTAMADALAAETLAMRRDLGLTDYRDDIIEILIDVAPFSDNLIIDGKVYQHGHWYKVSRRQADSMRESMARSWDSEERAGNPNKKFRREAGAPMNSMLMERRTSDGALTIGASPVVHGRTGAISGIREVA